VISSPFYVPPDKVLLCTREVLAMPLQELIFLELQRCLAFHTNEYRFEREAVIGYD
jgi:hypothetical protein